MRQNSFFGRHAEPLIYLGPIVEGFVGGISTFNGVVHALVFTTFFPIPNHLNCLFFKLRHRLH
jgi:hypothetical protein